jgi:two-component system response regulator MprA
MEQIISAGSNGHQLYSSTILAVDDDPALVRMLSHALRHHGFQVSAACNGEDAIGQIALKVPDLIILDLAMPVMDGRAFYHALRRRGHETPVLVLSAYEARRAQIELGADGYLGKPFHPDDLVDAVRRLLPAG